MKPSIPAGVGAQLTALAGPLAPYLVELLLTTRLPLDALEVRLSRWECEGGFVWNTFDTRALCPACNTHHVDTQRSRSETGEARKEAPGEAFEGAVQAPQDEKKGLAEGRALFCRGGGI